MKNITKLIVAAVAVAGLLGASNVVAQRNYDPKTVETVEGKVLSVEKTAAKRGYGVHLTLQTDKETICGASGTGLVHRQADSKDRSQRYNHCNRISRND